MFPSSAIFKSLNSNATASREAAAERFLGGFQSHLDDLIESRSRGSELIFPNEMKAAEEILKICIDKLIF